MNPIHLKVENIADENCIAHAPYNFVELPEDIVKAEPLPVYNCYHKKTEHQVDGNTIEINRHTGKIECTLITKSPLYTRTGWSPDDFAKYGETLFKDLPDEIKRKRANFYMNPATGKVTISGSSLRGMLRTLIEIVSFSKIEKVTNNKLFYRSLEKNYQANFVESLGKVQHAPHSEADCYRSKVSAGFLRKRGNSYTIEQCEYGRIHFDLDNKEKSIIKGLVHHQLYEGDKQVKTPKWQYQNKIIYVEIDDFEKDYFFHKKLKIDKKTAKPKINTKTREEEERHGNMYLRFRKVHSASWTEAPNLKKARLVISGNMEFKHLEFVFLEDKILETYPIDKEIVSRFQDDDQVTKWQAKAFPKGTPFPKCREKNGYLRDGEPVFFLLNDDGKTVRFLGRAQIFRLPYDYSALDFVPPKLRNHSSTDITEAIFGYVSGKLPREKTCASRVFITDATLKEEYRKKVQLCLNKEPQQVLLSSPKLTTFQHYLVQPKETLTNQRSLKHYASNPPTGTKPGETVVRGHKLYWHKPYKIEIAKNEDSDTQTSLIKPIESNVEFTFKIYFENLSDVELGALLWVLDKAGKPEYCLSLGMGKPLGMGAVKLKVDKLNLDNRKTRYTQLFTDKNQWECGEISNIPAHNKACIKAFENYILKHIHTSDNPNQATSLDEIRRIQMLLTMLQCEGLPDAGYADYMTLKSGNYQRRHVLPTPLQVAKKSSQKKVEPPKKKTPNNNSKAWEKSKRPNNKS